MTKITFCSGFKLPTFEEFHAEYEAFCKENKSEDEQMQRRAAKVTN